MNTKCSRCRECLWSSGNMTVAPGAGPTERWGLIIATESGNEILYVLCKSCTQELAGSINISFNMDEEEAK